MLTALEKPEVRRMVRPISIEEYYRLFGNEKTELIDGTVFYKMPKTALYSAAIRLLCDCLRRLVEPKVSVMSENPLRIQNSEPEPDIALVKPLLSLRDPHPTYAYLVVEISVTTQAFDEAKAGIYAAGKIPVYWNILPEERAIVVYSQPEGNAYKNIERITFDDNLDLMVEGDHYTFRLTDVLK